jgi:hypothetical protein
MRKRAWSPGFSRFRPPESRRFGFFLTLISDDYLTG